jgi:hypothetical protein
MKTKLLLTGILGLAIGLPACSNDMTTTTPSSSSDLQLNHDVAVVEGDNSGEDVEMMGGPQGDFGFGIALAAEVGPIAARFFCQSKTRDHLTVTRSCVFKDSTGTVQNGYDPQTTEEVDIDAAVKGDLSRWSWSASVDRSRHIVVSGLTGHETTRTWDGTGSGTISRSRHTYGGESRTYDMSYTTTITSVVVPVPHSEDHWPLSGSIARHVTVKFVGGPRDGQTVNRDVTVTFNGTRYVPAVVNGESFTLDLRTRRLQNED